MVANSLSFLTAYWSSKLLCLAIPKSSTLRLPLESKIIFEGLRSLCITPREWAYIRASVNCSKIIFAFLNAKPEGLFRLIICSRVSPSMSSIVT